MSIFDSLVDRNFRTLTADEYENIAETKNNGWFGWGIDAFQSGIAGSLRGIPDAIHETTGNSLAKDASDWLGHIAAVNNRRKNPSNLDYLTDPQGLFYDTANAAGSSAGLWMPIAAGAALAPVTGGGSLAAGVTGAATTASNVSKLGTVYKYAKYLSTLPEAVSEMGTTMREGREMGLSQDDILSAGGETFLKNMALLGISNGIEGQLGEKVISKLISDSDKSLSFMNRLRSGAKSFLGYGAFGAGQNFLEEGYQSAISNKAKGLDSYGGALGEFNPLNWNDEDLESAKIGGMTGLFLGGVPAGITGVAQGTFADKESNNVSNSSSQSTGDYVAQNLENGVSIVNAGESLNGSLGDSSVDMSQPSFKSSFVVDDSSENTFGKTVGGLEKDFLLKNAFKDDLLKQNLLVEINNALTQDNGENVSPQDLVGILSKNGVLRKALENPEQFKQLLPVAIKIYRDAYSNKYGVKAFNRFSNISSYQAPYLTLGDLGINPVNNPNAEKFQSLIAGLDQAYKKGTISPESAIKAFRTANSLYSKLNNGQGLISDNVMKNVVEPYFSPVKLNSGVSASNPSVRSLNGMVNNENGISTVSNIDTNGNNIQNKNSFLSTPSDEYFLGVSDKNVRDKVVDAAGKEAFRIISNIRGNGRISDRYLMDIARKFQKKCGKLDKGVTSNEFYRYLRKLVEAQHIDVVEHLPKKRVKSIEKAQERKFKGKISYPVISDNVFGQDVYNYIKSGVLNTHELTGKDRDDKTYWNRVKQNGDKWLENHSDEWYVSSFESNSKNNGEEYFIDKHKNGKVEIFNGKKNNVFNNIRISPNLYHHSGNIYDFGYGGISSANKLKSELISNGISKVIDIRENTNSSGGLGIGISDILKGSGIEYIHDKMLAPSSSIRNLWNKETNYGKNITEEAWKHYVDAFRKQMVETGAMQYIKEKYGSLDKPFVLLCTEKSNKHCHRSLVAKMFAKVLGNTNTQGVSKQDDSNKPSNISPEIVAEVEKMIKRYSNPYASRSHKKIVDAATTVVNDVLGTQDSTSIDYIVNRVEKSLESNEESNNINSMETRVVDAIGGSSNTLENKVDLALASIHFGKNALLKKDLHEVLYKVYGYDNTPIYDSKTGFYRSPKNEMYFTAQMANVLGVENLYIYDADQFATKFNDNFYKRCQGFKAKDGSIFLRKDSSKSPLFLIGHEFTHTLVSSDDFKDLTIRDTDSGLLSYAKKLYSKLVADGKLKEILDGYAELYDCEYNEQTGKYDVVGSSKSYNDMEMFNEVFASLVGDRVASGHFLEEAQDLFTGAKGKFARLVNELFAFMQFIKKKVKKFLSEDIMKVFYAIDADIDRQIDKCLVDIFKDRINEVNDIDKENKKDNALKVKFVVDIDNALEAARKRYYNALTAVQKIVGVDGEIDWKKHRNLVQDICAGNLEIIRLQEEKNLIYSDAILNAEFNKNKSEFSGFINESSFINEDGYWDESYTIIPLKDKDGKIINTSFDKPVDNVFISRSNFGKFEDNSKINLSVDDVGKGYRGGANLILNEGNGSNLKYSLSENGNNFISQVLNSFFVDNSDGINEDVSNSIVSYCSLLDRDEKGSSLSKWELKKFNKLRTLIYHKLQPVFSSGFDRNSGGDLRRAFIDYFTDPNSLYQKRFKGLIINTAKKEVALNKLQEEKKVLERERRIYVENSKRDRNVVTKHNNIYGGYSDEVSLTKGLANGQIVRGFDAIDSSIMKEFDKNIFELESKINCLKCEIRDDRAYIFKHDPIGFLLRKAMFANISVNSKNIGSQVIKGEVDNDMRLLDADIASLYYSGYGYLSKKDLVANGLDSLERYQNTIINESTFEMKGSKKDPEGYDNFSKYGEDRYSKDVRNYIDAHAGDYIDGYERSVDKNIEELEEFLYEKSVLESLNRLSPYKKMKVSKIIQKDGEEKPKISYVSKDSDVDLDVSDNVVGIDDDKRNNSAVKIVEKYVGQIVSKKIEKEYSSALEKVKKNESGDTEVKNNYITFYSKDGDKIVRERVTITKENGRSLLKRFKKEKAFRVEHFMNLYGSAGDYILRRLGFDKFKFSSLSAIEYSLSNLNSELNMNDDGEFAYGEVSGFDIQVETQGDDNVTVNDTLANYRDSIFEFFEDSNLKDKYKVGSQYYGTLYIMTQGEIHNNSGELPNSKEFKRHFEGIVRKIDSLFKKHNVPLEAFESVELDSDLAYKVCELLGLDNYSVLLSSDGSSKFLQSDIFGGCSEYLFENREDYFISSGESFINNNIEADTINNFGNRHSFSQIKSNILTLNSLKAKYSNKVVSKKIDKRIAEELQREGFTKFSGELEKVIKKGLFDYLGNKNKFTPFYNLATVHYVASRFPALKPIVKFAKESRLVEDRLKKSFFDFIDKNLNKFSGEEKESLLSLFLVADGQRRELSDVELHRMASDNVVKTYKHIRHQMDRVFNMINKARFSLGLPALEYINGYFPHHWDAYTVYAKIDGENVVYNTRDYTDAISKAKELSKDDPLAKLEVFTSGFYSSQKSPMINGKNVISKKDFFDIDVLDNDSFELSASEIQSMPDDLGSAIASHDRFLTQAMKRTGKEGYSIDVEHVLKKYFNTSARYIALAPFKSKAISCFCGIYGRDSTGKIRRNAFDYDYSGNPEAAYAKKYIEDINGTPHAVEKMLDAAIESVPSVAHFLQKHSAYGSRYSVGIANNISEFVALSTLGLLNPSVGIVQLSQVLNAGVMVGHENALSALKRLVSGKLTSSDKYVIGKSHVEFDSSMANEGYSKGGKFSYNKITNALAKCMYLFEKGDMLSRKVALCSAFEKGLKDGLSREEALKYAMDVNRKCNFDNSVVDSPALFRNAGVVGQVVLQFKKYGLNQMQFAYETFYENGDKEKRIRFLKGYCLLAGVLGLPLVGIPNKLFEFLFGTSATDYIRDELIGKSGDVDWITQNFLYGVGSNLGVDLSRRSSQDFDLLAAPPFINKLSDFISGLGGGDYIKALKAIFPTLGNVAIAYSGHPKGINDLKYSNTEAILRGVGFIPIREAVSRDRQYASMKAEEKKKHDKVKDGSTFNKGSIAFSSGKGRDITLVEKGFKALSLVGVDYLLFHTLGIGHQQARVVRVLDGDTVKLDTGDKVRFIGVNTPEIEHEGKPAEKYGYEASKFIRDNLLNQVVDVYRDFGDTDDYGRKLRYVYLKDGTDFNKKIIENGLGKVLIVGINRGKESEYKKADDKRKSKYVPLGNEFDYRKGRFVN